MLKALKKGAHGPFNITEVLNSYSSYMVIDAEAQKLALVNTPVPSFNGRGEAIRFDDMTVVFPIADIESISAHAFTDVNVTINFKFTRQIPSWNIDKSLSFGSVPNARKFFDKYLPHIPVQYTLKTKDGNIEPWV
ncbi:hypothetical protein RO575_08590 [Methylomonas sp. MO1]|uniref:hypothetical protein n=1 Tax=Methylomonas sp. MO1 TaxID=3073619 RepID=UPI0028A55A59|nr:hypothetical protein [Methylomonas sp. MO1]MDT4289614.1 hypothetical protein [Methylomonas sp. MO1]